MGIRIVNPPVSLATIVAALGYTPADAGAVVMGDGSVSSPGMFFGSDVDTGFYKVAANTLGVAAGGVDQAQFIAQIAPHASQPAPQRDGVSAFMMGREIGVGIKGSQFLMNCTDSFVDFEIRSSGLNPDYVEFRLGTGTGTGDENFVALSYRESQAVALLECWSPTGFASGIDISMKPIDEVSNAFINLGRSTNTAGSFSVYIHAGDGTNSPNYLFSGKSSGYMQIDSGFFGVGMDSGAAATLHVFDDRGSVTGEIARFSHSDKTLGLSLGVSDGGTTNTYLRHIYAGSPDAAFNIVFGATMTTSVTAQFRQDKQVNLYGKLSVADNTIIGSTSVAAVALLHLRSATDEKLRITGTGNTALGLSFGYLEAGNTTASIYNLYSGNNASKLQFGFGTTYGSLVALTLTRDLNAAFGGNITTPAGKFVGFGTATPLATLHVEDDSGATTGEIARFTRSVGGTALGLSLGYSDASTTEAYIYNRNTNAASNVKIGFDTTMGSTVAFAFIRGTGTIVNYGTVTGAATGGAVPFGVAGSDTDIDLALVPKGAGVVKFGTFTATGGETYAGYLSVKDSGGTARKIAVFA